MKFLSLFIATIFSIQTFAQIGGNEQSQNESMYDDESDQGEEFTPVIIPSILIGSSMPFGAYAAGDPTSTNYDFTKSFADPGTFMEIGIMFQVKSKLGITVGFNYFSNPVSTKRFGEYMEKYFDQSNVLDYEYRVKAGSWRNNSFLLGLAYRSPEKRASVELDLRFGLLTSRSPDIRIDSVDAAGNIDTYFKYDSELNFSLALAPGMKFKVRLIDALFLDLGASFIFSVVDLKDVYPEPYNYFGSSPNSSTNILTFNLAAGISYEMDW